MAYPVTLNGTTYTLADFEGTNYVDGLPNAFEDFVTHAGNTYQTTSTTSITLGTGTLVFTVADSGKPYSSGTPLRISNQADETDYIDALVTTYTGTTLTVNAVGYSGTGTIAAWNINIGGGPITVAGTLPISQGGTGATTAAAAATALGLGTGDTPTFAGLNVTGTANFGDVNITNVGDIALDTISSDAGTSVTVNLGSDAGDDFIVGSNYLVVEGDTGKVGIGTTSPSDALTVSTSAVNGGVTVSGSTDPQYFLNSSGGNQARFKISDASSMIQTGSWTNIPVGFYTNGTERLRILSTGDIALGNTAANLASNTSTQGGGGYVASDKHFEFATDSNRSTVEIGKNNANDGDIVVFRKQGNVVGSIGAFTSGTSALFFGSLDTALLANSGNDSIHPWNASTNSNRDNAIDLGNGSNRFNDLYATNGTIQTSDQNEKQQIAALTDAEITAAKAISQLFKTFKWNDKVAAKGDAARTHTGVIAQDVEAAMTAAGLDAGDYAFFISTDWYVDADGNEVEADSEGAIAKNRKGIRYPELLSFVGAATEQRLANIETRLTALESA